MSVCANSIYVYIQSASRENQKNVFKALRAYELSTQVVILLQYTDYILFFKRFGVCG